MRVEHRPYGGSLAGYAIPRFTGFFELCDKSPPGELFERGSGTRRVWGKIWVKRKERGQKEASFHPVSTNKSLILLAS